MTAYQRISVDQAKKIIAKKAPVIVDVRDVNSFQANAIPGARHVTFSNFPHFRKTLEKTKPVLVYCYHGNASQDMAQMFVDFGFSEVFSMDGGFEAWRLSV